MTVNEGQVVCVIELALSVPVAAPQEGVDIRWTSVCGIHTFAVTLVRSVFFSFRRVRARGSMSPLIGRQTPARHPSANPRRRRLLSLIDGRELVTSRPIRGGDGCSYWSTDASSSPLGQSKAAAAAVTLTQRRPRWRRCLQAPCSTALTTLTSWSRSPDLPFRAPPAGPPRRRPASRGWPFAGGPPVAPTRSPRAKGVRV